MPESSSVAYALTYLGTLGLALFLFLGQLVACGVLLVLAGIARVIILLVRQGGVPSNGRSRRKGQIARWGRPQMRPKNRYRLRAAGSPSKGHWPYDDAQVLADRVTMPFFLDYEAEGPVLGHVQIPRVHRDDALLYAQEALRGLRCLSAAVRCSETMRSAPAEHHVIARYTRSGGWNPVST